MTVLPSSSRLLAVVAVLAGVLIGCERPNRPNLLLITLDTTRADHLGSYGYPRDTSPALDALAARAVRFERAFSHVPITLPAHTSILSGRLPLGHGVRDNGRFTVPGALETLAETLADEGYATAAFVSGFVLDSRFGLDQGFDVYDDSFTEEWSESKLRDARIYNQMVTDRPADQTTDRALAWLRARGGGPWFVWVHYYDPHQRYAPPRPYDQLFRDNLYDGEIAFMDSQIGRLLDELEPRWNDTAIVVTGDHGEGFGQHGEATHAVLSYDSTLWVPLFVKAPARSAIDAGTVEQTVSHVDLHPTMLDLLGLPVDATVAGRSLVAAMMGAAPAERPAYFECALPRFSFGWEPIFGVRVDGWKYIHAPEPELYDLTADPDETVNLARAEEERREDLERLLFRTIDGIEEISAGDGEPREMSDEVRRKLAALGYLGGASGSGAELNPREPTGRRSPVEGVVLLSDYYLANGLAGRGQLREAAQIYRSTLLPLDPENPSFLTSLANLERKLGRVEPAFELFRRAQAIDPEDATTLLALAQLEIDRGADDAARELLTAALEISPDNLSAAYFAAELEAREGDSAAAIAGYRRALEIDDSHRESRIGLGLELAKSGEVDAAREEFRAALRVAPFSARAHYNLGLLELNAGEARVAVGAFERALRYRRPYPAASLALATALHQLGEAERAERELETLITEAEQETAVESAREMLAKIRAKG